MDFNSNSQSHALLQLHKWDSSQVQLNLREFREAFISPSREQLLLLSYNCEAALISLGESVDSKDHDTSSTASLVEAPSSSASFPELDSFSSTSASVDKVSDNNPSLGTSFSKSSNHPFLSDVCSLAWGMSGDSYDNPEETPFREFLFVSGHDSVIVHAFCESRCSIELEKHTAGVDVGEGKWVEWGPSTDSTCDLGLLEDSYREGEGPNGLSERGTHDQKKWLRTFLTDVEIIKLDDNVSTIFPKRSAFPSSAMVVSFSILGSTSSLLDLLIHTNAEMEKVEGWDDSVPNQPNSAIPKPALTSFKCFKLFSSSSHHLIGIALNLMEGVPLDSGGAHEEVSSGIFLLVGKLETCGIQWVSSVKLKDTLTQGLAADWTDFGLSDNLLVCLHATGNISFYGATTGRFLANMNILAACGLHHQLIPKDNGNSPGEDDVACATEDIQNDHGNAVRNQPSNMSINLHRNRVFRRLLAASHSSVMGVIDENGIVYAISADDHIPNKFHSFDKQNPQFQHSRLGILLGWEIGAADISRYYMCNDDPRVTQKNYSYNKVVKWESSMSGFFADRRLSIDEVSPTSMRNVFLPTEKNSQDDVVCFSPFGVTRLLRKHKEGQHGLKIVHSNLYVASEVGGKRCHDPKGWEAFAGDAIGCTSQGSCYLVTEGGLSVVLPSISVSADSLPVDGFGYLQSNISMVGTHQCGSLFGVEALMKPWPPWKIEVLDRVLIYEGPEVADLLCIENGWGLEISRLRRLQLALDYLKFDEIEISLEMLVSVNLAEEGVMRLLFVAVCIISHNVVNDSEISATSRLLGVSTCFATKMIRKYGRMMHMKDAFISQGGRVAGNSCLVPLQLGEAHDIYMRKLQRMAQLLEITRNLECRLSTKLKRPNQGWDEVGALSLIDQSALQDTPELSVPSGALSSDTSNQRGVSFGPSVEDMNNTEKFALMQVELSSSTAHSDSSTGVAILLTGANASGRKFFPSENPKDMMARWETDNLDLKAIVKDALLSGRLPLAVLQLHLHRTRDLVIDNEPNDTFSEVRDIGKAIAYDLFLEGETELAVETLHKLGEDVETSLRQLAFGTVRRGLRFQIAEEMRKRGYLGEYDWKMLETITLIERVYPCCSFWKTFHARKNELARSSNTDTEEVTLSVPHLYFFKDIFFECGEVDGVVFGSWANINRSPYFPVPDEDSVHSAYWAVAAFWLDAWDQRTIERIILDRDDLMDVDVLWESRLEYHICHNDWVEVSKLLEMIPPSFISCGDIQVALDTSPSVSPRCNNESPDYLNSVYGLEDLDAVCMDVSNVRVFISSATNMSSVWLKTLMEQQLATKFIFMKTYWEGTAEMVPLLARSGFISGNNPTSVLDESGEASSEVKLVNTNGSSCRQTMLALHKVVMHHLVAYNLPTFLDVYLDHHKLALDKATLSEMQESTRDSQWAKWLLFSRVKGLEYDSSFSNARSVASHNLVHGNNLSLLEIDDIIRTVDDIAEDGEFAALATLMYASVPIQDCLSSSTVSRLSSSSVQCTLESLRSSLEHFPTLWRTLVAACFGEDSPCNMMGTKIKGLSVDSNLSDYLSWRDSIFFSTGYDTSLLQMLPFWFPKAVRRLVQLYVQGPLGWQSLSGLSTGEFPIRYTDIFDQHAEISAKSWEAAIEKHIQEELYTSSVEVFNARESGLGLEHHLHRGRALAAFKHLLSIRVQKLKLDNTQRGQSGNSAHGQSHLQTDVQALLAPITQIEESLLSSVVPLAIMHFEDSVLVASCGFLLELCGLSSSMLKVDVAALRRISSFYKSDGDAEHYRQPSPTGSNFRSVSREGEITDSLARALADEYLHINPGNLKKTRNLKGNRQPSRVLMLVLQHLEKSSLPVLSDGKTCGSWLLTGNGDGGELRSRQKIASDRWNLVTIFCQMHQIPLSINYLAVLARDNDWVGFLSEAQLGGYPFERIVYVAMKEFSDPRLRTHLLTVLKGMQSRKKVSSSSHSDTIDKRSETPFVDQSTFIPVELFGILADCEKQGSPGKSLLLKAKDMCWPLLAMIASCFSDVSPLSCLTVWLEITAARETSSIKVNDVASQIASNVAAVVEATNRLPACARAVAFHYNRTNAKRRRFIEPILIDAEGSTVNDVSVSGRSGIYVGQGSATEDQDKRKDAEQVGVSSDPGEVTVSLSNMVAVLCEQHLFLPLLRAFEIFLPSCSLLPFIRALQAFSQMRVSDASAHLGSFSTRIREESVHLQTAISKEQIGAAWISSTAVKAADAVLLTCPSPYEKRCLLQLLSATDFADGGSTATYYRQLHWKINLAEPPLRTDDGLHLGDETLDDASLLTALKNNGHWEQARNWARQLEANGGPWKSAGHQVTETQAESMVAEWKEFLWDVPEERVALWGHCQTLFVRYSFPALQAGLFFLKHAEAVEKDLPSTELHEMLLLSLQWLSGMITQCNPVYPLHLLREIETRVWLLAVESEAQLKSEGEFSLSSSGKELGTGKSSNIIDRTAGIITRMDNHINQMRIKASERNDVKENSHTKSSLAVDASFSTSVGGSVKTKRRSKGFIQSRRHPVDSVEKSSDSEGTFLPANIRNDLHIQDDNFTGEASLSRWEERVGMEELERAVLSLLEFGQITAAKQLQNKLSPGKIPTEFVLIDAALKLAAVSTPNKEVSFAMLDEEVRSVIQAGIIMSNSRVVQPLQALENLTTSFMDGSGRGLCKRIVAVVKAANMLGLSFWEAFDKQPIELLQLLSLKAQDSFEEAYLLVKTHSMPATSIAQVLAESFLKGLLAAHRGGYMDSQKEEGPAPLLWRFSDFLKWAELCPSEPEIGHALMRLVITGQEIPHACEVELLILSHHFYKLSACLDGVDVLVALAATRVEAYVSEGDFSCLARLITGVGNFHALNFILGILIENGQLDLLLRKFSAAADTSTGTAEAVRGFRMSVLTTLKQFSSSDMDALAMVYNHFDMKHETASLLESRAEQSSYLWFLRYDRDQNEDLLDAMRYYIEAAEVHSSIDAGNKTHAACARASLVSLQIRMPDFQWLNLSETNARRALVEQSRFQEALIVADAYGLNQPSEWALVLWNQMLKPELTEQFMAEFVAVLPLHPSMLADLARFYRAEVAARGDQSQFSVWLTGGGLPAEWLKYLGRSFRCLLKRTRDLRLRVQLATVATGFVDVIDACAKALDKVPENAGPLVLRKGHGGAYLPLM